MFNLYEEKIRYVTTNLQQKASEKIGIFFRGVLNKFSLVLVVLNKLSPVTTLLLIEIIQKDVNYIECVK